MIACIHTDCDLHFCQRCGRRAQINEKFKKDKETGQDVLVMWTRIWKDPK